MQDFFYLCIFILLTKKLSKIKTFLTVSQPGHVLSMLVTILLYLSLNVLIKKVLPRKRACNDNVNEHAKGFTFQSFRISANNKLHTVGTVVKIKCLSLFSTSLQLAVFSLAVADGNNQNGIT